ncbi:MAG: hypothetical protein RL698_1407 [Pseudomonadota bacterium]|jgi:hypothetical protein
MSIDHAIRLLPLGAASTWLAALAALVFLGLGLRALLDPGGASAFFGVPVAGEDGLAFVRVYGARNVGISLVALALIALDMRLGLAAVLFAAALIAGLDFAVVASHSGALRAAKHLGYVVALTAFGWWFASRG